MKKIVIVISLVLAFILGMSTFSGCNKKKVSNDENTLEIYISDFGYGYEWLNDIITDFKNEQWVKEKYPKLNIPDITKNSVRSYPHDKVASGNTTFDLLFACASGASSFENKSQDSKYLELTDLYESIVPGENIKFKDKMDPNFLYMSQYYGIDEEQRYYFVPWITGMQGLLYNKSKFESLNLKVPNTTEELKKLCDDILTKDEIPFMFSSKADYWTCMLYLIWWAQYEGIDNYANYYKGLIDDGTGSYIRSVNSQKQDGRKYSLEVIEKLITVNNDPNTKDYVYDNVNTEEFSFVQSKFFKGMGMMAPNGDWVDEEVRNSATSTGSQEITFMKTPVISEIINKCESIENDEELSNLISSIDNGSTDLQGNGFNVTQKDFDKIYEARKTILPVGNHQAVIPSYAKGKEIAKDFLLYMATDKACNTFIEATNGATLPFTYDIEAKDEELYKSLSLIQKDRLNIVKNGGLYMPNENTFKTVYLGGISRANVYSKIELKFTAQNSKDRKTALQIYNDELAYWMQSETRWATMLSNCGY